MLAEHFDHGTLVIDWIDGHYANRCSTVDMPLELWEAWLH
jgi:hypothetical protein